MPSQAFPLSLKEQSAARVLRETVAPVLAEGVTCALRDQPSDPAAYMADFVATRATDSAQHLLDQRRLGQECARLDAELATVNDQLKGARAERARRIPTKSDDVDADHNVAAAVAAWSEVRRIKRLVRSMKIKIKEPLGPSDWPIPEGLVLVQGGQGMGTGALCRQLAHDFGICCVDNTPGRIDPLGAVLAHLRDAPTGTVLLEGFLDPARGAPSSLLTEVLRRVGPPTALLLLHCDEESHARLVVEEACASGEALSTQAVEAITTDWRSRDLLAVEAAARDGRVPTLRVTVDGDFTERMTALLVAVSAS